jgi:hypothetical protein
LGQAIDIYDTLWAAYDLYTSNEASQEEKEEAYFGMALAAVGWIPGPGDGIKKTLKTINKNPKKYAPLLLDAVRAALYQAGYKVDAYAFLMDSIDSARLGSIIGNVRSSVVDSSSYQRCPEFVQQGVLMGLSMAQSSVPMVVGVVERKVVKWLKSSPKSTGKGTPAHSKKTEKEEETKPINDPQTQHGNDKVGQDGKSRLAQVANGTENAAEIVVSHISQSQEGLGEHVADYYCLHSLAAKDHLQHHDTGGRSSVKRSDFGKLTQLVTGFKARGGGIDAIWKTAGAKKYAITEYKTRETGLGAVAMRSLLVLESAQDADAKPAHRKKRSEYKQANKQAAKTGVPHDLSKPELKSTVPKMSHKWIEDRIEKVKGLDGTDKDALASSHIKGRWQSTQRRASGRDCRKAVH